jgi:hypothetical protein
MDEANTLAYYDRGTIITVKNFYNTGPRLKQKTGVKPFGPFGAGTIKLFAAVIYGFY